MATVLHADLHTNEKAPERPEPTPLRERHSDDHEALQALGALQALHDLGVAVPSSPEAANAVRAVLDGVSQAVQSLARRPAQGSDALVAYFLGRREARRLLEANGLLAHPR